MLCFLRLLSARKQNERHISNSIKLPIFPYVETPLSFQSLSHDRRSKRPIANTGENRYNCYNCDVDFCSVCAHDQKTRFQRSQRQWMTTSTQEDEEEEEEEVLAARSLINNFLKTKYKWRGWNNPGSASFQRDPDEVQGHGCGAKRETEDSKGRGGGERGGRRAAESSLDGLG